MAVMDFSRPTKIGATILGKTTSSRVGSSGRAAAGLALPGSEAARGFSGGLGVTFRRRLLRLGDERRVDALLDASRCVITHLRTSRARRAARTSRPAAPPR